MAAMKPHFITLFFMIPFALLAAATGDVKNLLDNGDLEKSGGWKGDGRIGKMAPNDENKVYILQLGPKDKEFEQTVSLNGKYSVVEFTYRVRASADFKQKNDLLTALQMQLYATPRNGPYLVGDRKIKKVGEWLEMKMRLECPGAKELRINIVVHPGAGDLYFDDFVLTAK